jgi:protein tyrosine/serine phosphatase
MELESIRLFGIPGLVNVGRVTEGIYRGADPDPVGGYKSLADLGIRTVLNLSHGRDSEHFKQYGIREIYTPMNFFRDVDESRIRELVGLLSNASLQPIYVHCAQGRDRTGMVVACYRIESGWSNKDAIDEMWSFGFHFVWSHFLEFVRGYKK